MNTVKDFENFHGGFHSKKKKNNSKKIFLLVIAMCIILGVGFLYVTKIKPQQKILSQEEIVSITEDMSQIAILPQEEPVVFMISDVGALVKDQAFFNNAQNGDVLFIFPQAVKAVIYSPSRNMIVNMGPVSFDQSQVTNSQKTIETQEQVDEITPVSDSQEEVSVEE